MYEVSAQLIYSSDSKNTGDDKFLQKYLLLAG